MNALPPKKNILKIRIQNKVPTITAGRWIVKYLGSIPRQLTSGSKWGTDDTSVCFITIMALSMTVYPCGIQPCSGTKLTNFFCMEKPYLKNERWVKVLGFMEALQISSEITAAQSRSVYVPTPALREYSPNVHLSSYLFFILSPVH